MVAAAAEAAAAVFLLPVLVLTTAAAAVVVVRGLRKTFAVAVRQGRCCARGQLSQVQAEASLAGLLGYAGQVK